MKIRTEKDIEQLDYRIKTELGVDVRKYKNEEVVEKIVSMLVFPEYVLTWMLGPVLLALVFFGLGFYLLQLVHVEFVLYAIFGLVLFLAVGLVAGLLLFTGKMKKDIGSIAAYSLAMTKDAVLDINTVNQSTDPAYKKEAYGLLFKGIIHIVTIPMTTKAVTEKLPLLGRLINRFIRKFFMLISDRIKFDEMQIASAPTGSHSSTSSKSLETYSKSMTLASMGMGKLMGLTFGVVRFPLKVVLVVVSLLLFFFLWAVN